MSADLLKQTRINTIISTAAKQLHAEGVQYFIGVVDRRPTEPDGGKAYAESDIRGENMGYILDMAFPTRNDLISLGVWVGQLITSREAALKEQNNGNKKK